MIIIIIRSFKWQKTSPKSSSDLTEEKCVLCTFPLSPSRYFSLFWGLAVNLSACSGCHRGIYRLVRARCCARVAIHGDGEIVQINHQLAKHTPLQIQDTPWPLGIYKKKVCHEWGELKKKREIWTPVAFGNHWSEPKPLLSSAHVFSVYSHWTGIVHLYRATNKCADNAGETRGWFSVNPQLWLYHL